MIRVCQNPECQKEMKKHLYPSGQLEHASHFAKRKYCSHKCYKTVPITEEVRKKMSIAHKTNPSRPWLGKKVPRALIKLRTAHLKGNKHALGKRWVVLHRRNPQSSLLKFLRGTTQMKAWKFDVMSRDGFRCQECGRLRGNLEADHIRPFALLLKESGVESIEEALFYAPLWDIKNGRTLCRECHQKTPTFGWNGYRYMKNVLENKLIK